MDARDATLELIRPHGGTLKDLYLSEAEADAERDKALELTSYDLSPRQLCDIELLLNGAFSPLEGFLGRADYESVLESMRLTDGTLWPMPSTLDVSQAFADGISPGDEIALRDQEGVLIATMRVDDIWTPDKAAEARGVFGTEDVTHPGVHYLMHQAGPVYLGGKLRGVESPVHYDFKYLRDTPAELRQRFTKLGWRKIVAFQTATPCIARTRNSPSGPPGTSRPTC